MKLLAFDYSARAYLKAYVGYINDFWDQMTPMQYGYTLMFVGLCGYVLMRSTR